MSKDFSTTRYLTRKKPQVQTSTDSSIQKKLFSETKKLELEGGLRTEGLFKKSYPGNPLVSIITVVYNGDEYLEDTITSVLQQSYDNIEYIIVDGSSSDQTLDIIKKYSEAIDYWISEPDDGIYDAMNKGLELTQGKLIGILNADDWYEHDAVEKVVKACCKHERVSMIHGMMKLHEEEGENKSIYGLRQNIDPKYIAPFNHPTCFVARDVYEDIGIFDTSYKTASDYDWMLRVLKSDKKIVYLKEILTNFRKTGITSSMAFAPYFQIWNILRNNNYNYISSLIAISFRVFRDLAAKLINNKPLLFVKKYLGRHLPYKMK